MNPIIKRFLKGFLASFIVFGLDYLAKNAGLLISSPVLLSVLTGTILAIEKALPNNL